MFAFQLVELVNGEAAPFVFMEHHLFVVLRVVLTIDIPLAVLRGCVVGVSALIAVSNPVVVSGPATVVFALFVNEASSVTACAPMQAVMFVGFVLVLGVLACSEWWGGPRQVGDDEVIGWSG